MITIHILPNISTSKSSETMRFGYLKKYRKKNIFFKSHAQSEIEKSKLSILWINSGKIYPISFYYISKLSTTEIY